MTVGISTPIGPDPFGGGGGSGTGDGGGQGSGPGGFGGLGGYGGTIGAAEDLAVALAPGGQSLVITLTPNNLSVNDSTASYTIYWLDPAKFSQNDIYANSASGGIYGAGGTGLSVFQGRQKVIDLAGGAGIVSATVPYLPYVTGGWMYAVVFLPGITRELRLQGTNFVAVPPYNTTTLEPLAATVPTNVNIQASTISGVNRLVQFSWTNAQVPPPYIKITAVNYCFDGFQRDLIIFTVNTPPGATQGPKTGDFTSNAQAVVLEADSTLGAHNIDWYFVPMSTALVPLHLTGCPKVTTGFLV